MFTEYFAISFNRTALFEPSVWGRWGSKAVWFYGYGLYVRIGRL